MKTNKLKWAALAATVLLAACATKSNVKADGTTDEPVFPKPYSLTFNNDRGTFPTDDELDKMRPGLTKDDIYKILGRPHYDEGMFNVREWDYLFHFYTPGVGVDPDNTSGVEGITTCQYKVIYDKDKFARSFYWKPVFPEDAVCPPRGPAKPKTQSLNLGADALFAFDKSGPNDMLPAGYAKLDRFAEDIKRFERVSAIRIIGYTDRKGSDSYNNALSQRRAETVRQYLITRGVPAVVMSAQGLGKRNPLVECSTSLPRNEEIACLQPNRRVVIEVDGVGELTVE
ncbi:outer membrane protein assembly factor BamE [Neisseria animalis]|uniref:Outer membrane protein assembly factor BamE n=2 Tax=Neisseria animalis TaxID=492 RepID=A0A5P3MTT4_NEIAN|nr:outer membrane protein assembly factor BamE [Neisseria animalis]ROW31520.1 outer membrane protein assembly factor BamE [Neisseria animalis]